MSKSATTGHSPQTVAQGIEDALLHRISPSSKLTDNGRRFANLSLIEMGRDMLDANGISTRTLSRFEVAGLMMQSRAARMGTSDFPSLLANVANKRLRQAYDENPATYRLWARRASDAPDFKQITSVQLSAMPDLLQTNEHGEFKYGALTDGKEAYSLLTYGRIVNLSRQALVNDDIRGFDRVIAGFAASGARLENRTVYAQLTANAALNDTVPLFHASHANLASGGGSALQVSSLAVGRAAMRLQKGLQSEELNLAPAWLIVPAALEQTAYQLTSAGYVPATPGGINEFRAGGRTSLQPVIEPLLDANSSTAWYMAALTAAVDTVEFCYLDGADGPVVESEPAFGSDGIRLKARLDFAAKAMDFRGLYKSAGA